MSVKLMTTEQIHTNLASIHNMWSGGVPPEQVDQVNALKSELKRRGVEMNAQAPILPRVQAQAPEGMTMEQLQLELAKVSLEISKSPNDDSLQERFANVRFELRQRASRVERTPPPPMMTPDAPEPTNGTNGHSSFEEAAVVRRTAEMPRGSGIDVAAQAQARMQSMQEMEALVRKHNLAKLAADSASRILSMNSDPNGDDIDSACNIGMAVAEKIFEKVGL